MEEEQVSVGKVPITNIMKEKKHFTVLWHIDVTFHLKHDKI